MPADGTPDVRHRAAWRLRPEQEQAMVAQLEGHDALVALPTGFGKSLIYQALAMILERPRKVTQTLLLEPRVARRLDRYQRKVAFAKIPQRQTPDEPSKAEAVATEWRHTRAIESLLSTLTSLPIGLCVRTSQKISM